ncbi:hypothetical protein [Jiangella muralis]|uniref:hypothetical protein n=1 Tax=Jiangella muralis TaxID=702383 RepID=UPI00069E9A9A|nr:hypothetical protein [Jiangella muralis]
MTHRPVALGATCDLHQTSDDGRSVSFTVTEFVEVEGSRRVVLRGDLGFTTGWSSPFPVRESYTEESLTRDVLNVVLPDEDESGEDHPWDWLAELARDRGVIVTADQLRSLPYEVELTERVLHLISAG